jgi:hypothetical protein
LSHERKEPVDESAADAVQAVVVEGRELGAKILARQFQIARKSRGDDIGSWAQVVVHKPVGAYAPRMGLQEIDYFAHKTISQFAGAIIRRVISCRPATKTMTAVRRLSERQSVNRLGAVVEGGAELLVQRTSLRPTHCREPMHAPWDDAKRVVDLEMAT